MKTKKTKTIENLIINENIIERKELLQIMKKLPARKTYR